MYGVGPQPPRIEPATQANVRIRARKIVRSRNAGIVSGAHVASLLDAAWRDIMENILDARC